MSLLQDVVETVVVRRKFTSRSKIDGKRRSSIPEYKIWTGMVARCNNPKHANYKRYGGRGITICDRWLSDFENFYRDMGARPTSRHSIDRVDNDGDYSPENCRWATPREQILNRGYGAQSWTEAEYRTLRTMYAQYFSVEEIAVALDSSVPTVRLRIHLEGLKREAFFTRLVKRNKGLHAILVHKGKEHFLAAIDARVRERKQADKARADAERRLKAERLVQAASSDKNRNQQMREMRIAGANLSEIAREFNISRERVRQIEAKGFPDFESNPKGRGRKISSTDPKVRDVKISRLCRAWNSASREARTMFLDAAKIAVFTSIDVDQVNFVAGQLGTKADETGTASSSAPHSPAPTMDRAQHVHGASAVLNASPAAEAEFSETRHD